MDILQQHQKQDLLKFIPMIKLDFAAWKLIEFRLSGDAIKDGFSITDAAEQMYELYAQRKGRLYICNDREIILFVKIGRQVSSVDVTTRIIRSFPEDSCEMFVHDIDDKSGLQKLEFVLIKSPFSASKEKAKEEKIPLLDQRVARFKNIAIIADDDMFMRSMAKTGLLEKCQEVIEFTDGKGVVEGYREHNPDIVFLDIHLPHKTGTEILQEILVSDPDAYIIMFSADSSREQVIFCLENGAEGFVTKPFTKGKLFEYLDKCPTIR